MNSLTLPPGKARLRRVMRGTEYFTLAFGSIVGVGWMVVLEEWFRRGGPVGAMLGFLVGGAALVPVVYVYGRLAERIPEAGSEVAYTGAVFPRSVSFATGWAMTLTYVMVCPWEAVSMGRIAAYSFPQIKTLKLYQVGGYDVYLPVLLIALFTAATITFINYRGVHQSTAFQNVTTFGLLAIFCVFAPLGLARGTIDNLSPLLRRREMGRAGFDAAGFANCPLLSPGLRNHPEVCRGSRRGLCAAALSPRDAARPRRGHGFLRQRARRCSPVAALGKPGPCSLRDGGGVRECLWLALAGAVDDGRSCPVALEGIQRQFPGCDPPPLRHGK